MMRERQKLEASLAGVTELQNGLADALGLIEMGIFAGMLRPQPGDAGWRIAFIFGLMLAPAFYTAFMRVAPTIRIEADYPLLAIAGLLVGLGTRFGAGCTSGHGVCGLSRLSPRSVVATLCFMAAGIVVVYLVRHALGG